MDDGGGLAYGVGVSLGGIMVVVVMALTLILCAPKRTAYDPPRREVYGSAVAVAVAVEEVSISIEQGLDEGTIRAFPELLYSEAKLHEVDKYFECCICLGKYSDEDILRLLPDCGHVFHLKCVDPWLRLHPTCPVCRNSSQPSSMVLPATSPVE